MKTLNSWFSLWCAALVPGLLCLDAIFTSTVAQTMSEKAQSNDWELMLKEPTQLRSEPLTQPEQMWPSLRPSRASIAIPMRFLDPAQERFGKARRPASPHASTSRSGDRRSSQLPQGSSRSGNAKPSDPVSAQGGFSLSKPSQSLAEAALFESSAARQFEHREALQAFTLRVRGETSLPEQIDLELDAKIKSKYEIQVRQPLVRSPQQEFALSLGFAYLDEEASTPSIGPGAGPNLGPGAGGTSITPPALAREPQVDVIPAPASAPSARPPLARSRPAPPPSSAPPEIFTPRPEAAAPPLSALASSPPPPGDSPPLPASDNRTSVIQLGQDYVLRDRSGRWRLASRFDFGTGLFDATATEGPGADGQYLSWNGQLERSQTLGPNHRLRLQLKTQIATDSLLKPKKFKMGKTIRERGLKTRDVSGDNGLLMSLQDQMTVLRNRETQAPLLQIVPLLEVGYVWNRNSAPPGRANSHFLTTANLGLRLTPTPFSSVGFNLQMPLFYENDLGETQPEETYAAAVTYRTQW